MKTQETQKADTKKTTALIKKHLKEKYNIKASVKSSKYSGGSSLRISYNCGPDNNIVKQELAGLQMGSFNGMEDIYEYNHCDAPVLYGYELQQYKYVFIEQCIPSEVMTEMCKVVDKDFNLEGLEKLEELHKTFKNRDCGAWTWSEFMSRNLKEASFITDDYANIKITGYETNTGIGWGFVFTYEYNGKTYKTFETINDNNNLNTTEMKKAVELKVGQEVKVTNKDGNSENGVVTKVNEKSIKYNVNGTEKLVMLANNDVEVLKDVEEKTAPATDEKPKADTKKAEKKLSEYGEFVAKLISDKVVSLPKSDVEKASVLELTKEGEKELTTLRKDYAAGEFKTPEQIKALISELGKIGKNMAEGAKATENKTETKTEKKEKAQPELHPVIEMLTKVTDEKSFEAAKKEVEKQKVEIISKKNKKVYSLEAFENNNIYVTNPDSERRYFCMPTRFGHHFDVK